MRSFSFYDNQAAIIPGVPGSFVDLMPFSNPKNQAVTDRWRLSVVQSTGNRAVVDCLLGPISVRFELPTGRGGLS